MYLEVRKRKKHLLKKEKKGVTSCSARIFFFSSVTHKLEWTIPNLSPYKKKKKGVEFGAWEEK